jgi:hypothetical protein
MIRFPLQQQQPIGPDIAAQYQQPQFMNIQHAPMEQRQQNDGGGIASGALNLGAALLAKYGKQPMSRKMTDAPLRPRMMMDGMGGSGDYV